MRLAELVQVFAAVHGGHARGQRPLLVTDECGVDILGRARQGEVLALAVCQPRIERGMQPGAADAGQQAVPARGQEIQRLLPVELGAVHLGLVAVDGRAHVVAAVGRGIVDDDADDVIVDGLMEQPQRQDAALAEVLLERGVEVERLVRLEVRIADLHFLVAVVHRQVRRDRAEARPRDRLVGRESQRPVLATVPAQVQTRQHVGVVVAGPDLAKRVRLAVGGHVDAVAGGVELGVLDARAGDHPQVADVPGAHRVGGQDVLGGHVVLAVHRQRVVDQLLAACGVFAAMRGPVRAHRRRADALPQRAVAMIGRGLGPVGQIDGRSRTQVLLVRVVVAVAPAPEQAELVAGVLAVETGVDLRAVFVVVDLLGRHHPVLEGVIGIVLPPAVGQAEIRDAVALADQRGQIVAVVLEARFLLVVHPLAGLGVAHAIVEHGIGKPVLAAETGRQRVLLLGAPAHALADRVGRDVVDAVLAVAERGHRAVAEAEHHALARLGILEAAEQRAQVIAVVRIRAPVEVEVGADAGAVDVVLAALPFGHDAVVAALGVGVVLALDVVGLELAVKIIHAQRDAEGAIGEEVAVVERGLRAGLAGQRLVVGLDLGADAAAVAVERGCGLDQDRAADRIARHVRGRRFHHLEPLGGF